MHTSSPSLGVLHEIVATGPVPVLVMALMLKVYNVEDLKPGTLIVVAFGSCTEIFCL